MITITVVKKPVHSARPSACRCSTCQAQQFDVYGARAAEGGAEIYTASIRDARFTWGATVGTTWKWLDFRETRHVALWLPELTVSAQAT
ncbi:MAG: hypothetical protein U5K74_12350 [Gemmatimonadaceae bacterium]|nr:hypothetical protein [Gemmatimonadaceae bacterium]